MSAFHHLLKPEVAEDRDAWPANVGGLAGRAWCRATFHDSDRDVGGMRGACETGSEDGPCDTCARDEDSSSGSHGVESSLGGGLLKALRRAQGYGRRK